jgi:hypothetical protein
MIPSAMTTGSTTMEHLERFLQQQQPTNGTTDNDDEVLRNRILYIAYLCVLGCCCITPCLYYIRISSWQRRQFREFREMERTAIIAALAQSTLGATDNNSNNNSLQFNNNNNNNAATTMEAAAIQAERRARILQLMEPVRMVRTLNKKFTISICIVLNIWDVLLFGYANLILFLIIVH